MIIRGPASQHVYWVREFAHKALDSSSTSPQFSDNYTTRREPRAGCLSVISDRTSNVISLSVRGSERRLQQTRDVRIVEPFKVNRKRQEVETFTAKHRTLGGKNRSQRRHVSSIGRNLLKPFVIYNTVQRTGTLERRRAQLCNGSGLYW